MSKATCAVVACHEAESCCLVGGCTTQRFGTAAQWAKGNPKLPRLNGTKPGRGSTSAPPRRRGSK